MRDLLSQRRDELTAELESGRKMLADLDARRAELQSTLLRISGALQVVTELLERSEPEEAEEAEEQDAGLASVSRAG